MNPYPQQEPEIQSLAELDLSAQYRAADYWRFRFEEMVEIIRGKIFKMAPAPSSHHQEVSGALFLQLATLKTIHKCKVFTAPFDVYLTRNAEKFAEAQNIVQPDICVVCNRRQIRKEGCVGAPDLVVEILSPSTRRKDLTVKKDLYEEYGVQELWIVSARERLVLQFYLKGEKYVQTTFTEGQNLPYKNLNIPLTAIFEDIPEEDF